MWTTWNRNILGFFSKGSFSGGTSHQTRLLIYKTIIFSTEQSHNCRYPCRKFRDFSVLLPIIHVLCPMTTEPPWCPPGLALNSIMLLGRALVLMNSSASWRPWIEGERPLGGSWGGTQNVGGGRDGNEEWIYDCAPAGSWDEQWRRNHYTYTKWTFQLNIAVFRSWVITETGTNETLMGFFFQKQ